VERTLVLLKPDAVQRGLIGRITARFEDKGLEVVGMKMRHFSLETIQQHYAVHAERPFYKDLVSFMTSGPVVAIALQGNNAITVVRTVVGPTNSAEAAPGTIRGDFGMSFSHNMIHASDSQEASATELALFFGDEGDLIDWTPCSRDQVYNAAEEL
jgi:nucleoside-diphosphate kinase